MTPEPKSHPGPSGRLQQDDHLQYLLTAYLFGNLSAAGKAEVEGHLKECARCRQELAELRGTLALTEQAILSGMKEYAFDDRRRARVLSGARQARHGFLARIGLQVWPRVRLRWTFASLAALFLAVFVGGLLLPVLSSARRYGGPYKTVKSPPAAKEAVAENTLATASLEERTVTKTHDMAKDRPPAEHPVVRDEVGKVSDHNESAGNAFERRMLGTGSGGLLRSRQKTVGDLEGQVKEERDEKKADRGPSEPAIGTPIAREPAPPPDAKEVAAAPMPPTRPETPASAKASTSATSPPRAEIQPTASDKSPLKAVPKDAEIHNVPLGDVGFDAEADRPDLRRKRIVATEQKPVYQDALDKELRELKEKQALHEQLAEAGKDTDLNQTFARLHGGVAEPEAASVWAVITEGDRTEYSAQAHKKDRQSEEKDGSRAAETPAIHTLSSDPDRAERLVRAFRFYRSDNRRLDLGEFLRRPASIPAPFPTDEGLDEDAFIETYGIRPFVDASRDRLSTFGLDVDTASYTRARALLQAGHLPPPETVRTEEFVNYFKQDYTVPPDETFGVFVEGMPAPFGASGMELLKIGIKSRDPRPDERKPAALTFVVDTSGSMARADSSGRERIELIRTALKGLVRMLQPEDSVCLVTFNDQARLALPRTQARFAHRILDALDRLQPGGATNVEAGLELGYRMADEAYSPEAINRIVFCSDGVANVGAQGSEPLLKRVQTFASRGIDLNAIGFGMGNYNDKVMQELAERGNGQYHFVNTPEEAQKVFREQLPPSLDTLARDAKAQVEFDPAVVKRYRLLGYEKRKIADADFRNDRIDAGEVHHATLVTALYEIERQPGAHGSLGRIFLRWKDAALPHRPVVERNYPLSEGLIAGTREAATPSLRFLACVAEFAELLRGSRWAQDGSYAAILKELAELPPDFRAKPEWDEVRKLVWQAHVLSMREWLGALKESGARSE